VGFCRPSLCYDGRNRCSRTPSRCFFRWKAVPLALAFLICRLSGGAFPCRPLGCPRVLFTLPSFQVFLYSSNVLSSLVNVHLFRRCPRRPQPLLALSPPSTDIPYKLRPSECCVMSSRHRLFSFFPDKDSPICPFLFFFFFSRSLISPRCFLAPSSVHALHKIPPTTITVLSDSLDS